MITPAALLNNCTITMRLSHFSFVLLLSFFFAETCASQRFNIGTLLVHPPDYEPQDVIEVTNLYIDLDNNILTVDIDNLATQEIIPYEEYCLSFTSTTGAGFHCFNYFQSNKNKPLHGTLSLSFKNNTTSIDDITFIPEERGNLYVKLVPSLKLGDPKPKLHTNDSNKEKQLIEKQIAEIEKREAEELKEKETLQQLTQNTDNENENENENDNDNDNEFQEIVSPNKLKVHKKTFIERNWMYIIPPSILFIIIGNVALGE